MPASRVNDPRTQGAALLASYPPRHHRRGFEERLAAWQELQQAGVPLPKTASGRTRPMAANQLEATFERMHEAGEEQQLKLDYKQREQRRSQNKERSRPQSAQVRTACVHRLYTEDCAHRELLHAQRAARAIRILDADKLCNVVALGKDARHELHHGRWPARTAPPPRPRDMPRPLDPTRLHVYGLEVLDMPPGQWQAVVAGDHAAPQAEMWSFDPPKW